MLTLKRETTLESDELFGADADEQIGNAQSAFDIQFKNDSNYFMNICMTKIRTKLRDGATPYEYWSGVSRELDIDILAFYQEHYMMMPVLSIAIRSVLGRWF